jgi:cardiolipin synthase A/B
MKMLRGLLVVMLGSCAVLGLLVILQPFSLATAAHAAASLNVAIDKVTSSAATTKWPAWQKSHAVIPVTLIYFTAAALPGQPEVYVHWETAIEPDTAGFYIARSASASGPWTRVSSIIPAQGDSVVGALYAWIDTTTLLNHHYYYRLEAVNTDQSVDYYGPLFVSTGEHVILSEVFYDAAGADNGLEWVELYNPTTDTIDLNNYSLGNGGSDYTVSRVQLTGTLVPSSCWVIGGPTSNITNHLPIFDQAIDFSPDFQNGPTPADGIALFDVKAISITTLTVPIDAVIYGTANTNNLIDETGIANPPDVAVAASGKSNERTTITGTWRVQAAPTPNDCTVLTTTVEPPPPPPSALPGSVLISAVHFSGYAAQDNDEGFRLTNVSTQPITLTNWLALKSTSQIQLTGTLQPEQSIWIAKTAVAFAQQFGFKPDYKYTADADTSVLTLTLNSVPAFGDSGKLVLSEGLTNTIDVVIWGPTTLTDTQWTGSTVLRYSDGNIATTGQIIYRKLDEAASKIVSDTNTALDWANDRADPVAGRKAQYPGWDLEKFWQTAKVTQTATLTVAIAPDNAYRVISDVLGSAQHSIVMEMHTFDNLGLLNVVTHTIRRGVAVTILLEGSPVGGIDDQELWVCQQIESAGGQCWFMISDTSNGNTIHARYDYVHAKMIVVDDRVVAIGSENLSPRTLTYDNFADGTVGHRGVYLVTDASGVVARAQEIWNTDFDPAHHRDISRWTITDTKYGPPPIGFTPNYSIEVGGYRILYPQPLVINGQLPFELLTAPESALRAGDSLLGWINRSGAGDAIDVEQLDEPPHWGDSTSNAIADPNLRLQALIDAAQRGAKVRLLLDRYFDDPTAPTSNAATQQYLESLYAISPTLRVNFEVRLGNPALYGLHNKMFLFNVGGRKVVHAGSLNGTETSNKMNREVALQVESSTTYDYLRAMFGYDWAFQPRALLPIVFSNYIAPPDHLLVSKVFYLGSISPITGSEWVQIYNPTPITVSLSGYKLGDQAAPGPTGFTADGMWMFPSTAAIPSGKAINVATTALGFSIKYSRFPDYVFFGAGLQMIPYITYTPNISFSLANDGDEVLLLGPADQLIDGVAWKPPLGGVDALPGNISCPAIDTSQYPEGTPNPSIMRSPLWKDTDNCPADFVIDPSALP